MGTLTVSHEEFENRRDRVVEELESRDLDGVLVWGRGGGPLERFANVYYLTDHYPAFPTIPDVADHWTARGHVAAVVSRRGDVGLATDSQVDVDDVFATVLETSVNVVAATAIVLRRCGLTRGRLGLLGADTLSVAHAAELREAVPDATMVPVPDFVEEIRIIKTAEERTLMRAAAAVGARAVAAMLEDVRPGVSEADVAACGASVVAGSGAALYNIFVEVSGPAHGRRRHRLPTYRTTNVLEPGDILAVDISGALAGYFFDVSRSRIAGGVGEPQARLISLTRDAVAAVTQHLVPGRTIGHAVRRGIAVLEAAGHSALDETFPAFGHGLGLGWERPWLVPDEETLIRPGMVLAVEKVLEAYPYAASFENDVLVTEDGPVVITPAPEA